MNHKSDVEAWATALILKRMRNANGLKQYQFAEEVGMNLHKYNRIENARGKLSQEDLEKIAEYYQTNVDDILMKIKKEIKILQGEEKEYFAREKINYVKIRDERYRNE